MCVSLLSDLDLVSNFLEKYFWCSRHFRQIKVLVESSFSYDYVVMINKRNLPVNSFYTNVQMFFN